MTVCRLLLFCSAQIDAVKRELKSQIMMGKMESKISTLESSIGAKISTMESIMESKMDRILDLLAGQWRLPLVMAPTQPEQQPSALLAAKAPAEAQAESAFTSAAAPSPCSVLRTLHTPLSSHSSHPVRVIHSVSR